MWLVLDLVSYQHRISAVVQPAASQASYSTWPLIDTFHSPLYHCDSDSDAAELRAGGHVAAASCDADTDHGAAFCIDSRLNSIWSLIKSSIKDLLYLK